MHAPVAAEDNRLLRSIPAARAALIERIARAAAGARSQRAAAALPARLFPRRGGGGSRRAHPAAPRAGGARASRLWRRGAPRGARWCGCSIPMRARDGFEIAHTLVLSVTDDMPFLVDSLGMAFSRAELAVHLIVHPVLQVRRDRRGQLIDIGANGAHATHPESWQLYEIDRVTDPAAAAQAATGSREHAGRRARRGQGLAGDARAGTRDHHAAWRAIRRRCRRRR